MTTATEITAADIPQILKNNGIFRNSRNEDDYTRAKHIIFGTDMWKTYDDLNQAIISYLGK